MFDVVAYLESKEIEYWTSGKNVSENWINIRCLFCDDQSNHLGINLETGVHNCWKCGSVGNMLKLIKCLEECTYRQAYTILEKFTYEGTQFYCESPALSLDTSFTLPKTTIDELPIQHKRYLVRRGFNPKTLQEKYNVKATLNIGRYRHRLIIPIYFEGKLVNFVARAINKQFDKRYLMPPTSDVLIRRDCLLYNADAIGKSIAIVEGVFDAWRIGTHAVATFGTRVTDEQCNILYRKKIERAFVIFDQDSSEMHGYKLAERLSHIIPHVENIVISEGDPDSYFLNHPNELKDIQFLLG